MARIVSPVNAHSSSSVATDPNEVFHQPDQLSFVGEVRWLAEVAIRTNPLRSFLPFSTNSMMRSLPAHRTTETKNLSHADKIRNRIGLVFARATPTFQPTKTTDRTKRSPRSNTTYVMLDSGVDTPDVA